MENLSVLVDKYLVINRVTQVYEEDIIPKVNQENTTSMIRKNHATRTPYLHLNHNNQCFNELVYLYIAWNKDDIRTIIQRVLIPIQFGLKTKFVANQIHRRSN
jgi:hypothetical protein